MGKLQQDILKYILAIAIVLGSPAPLFAARKSSGKSSKDIKAAVTEVLASTATEHLEGPNGAQADLSVTAIESTDEGKVLKEIVEAASGPVVIFDNGENLEQIKDAIEDLDLKEGQDVKIIEISAPDNRNWAQKFRDKVKRVSSGFKTKVDRAKENKKELAATILVNLAVTGLAGGVTYAFTKDLTTTFGTATVLFSVSMLRMVFTQQWLKYLDFGGRALSKLSDKVAFAIDHVFNRSSSKIYEIRNRVYGHVYNEPPKEAIQIDARKWSKLHEHAIDVTGSIAAAAVAGAATYIGVVYINGDLHVTSIASAFAIGLLGAASAYDYVFFDVAGRYLYKADIISYETYKKMLQTASIIAPSIDSVYVAVPHFAPVKYVVIGLGVSGLVMAYKGAQVVRAINTAKAKAITSLNSYFSKRRGQPPPTPCETLMTRDNNDKAA